MNSCVVPLGFAFVPDASAARQIVALHAQLHAQHPSECVLRTQGQCLPHVSVFQGQFRTEDVSQLAEGLKTIAQRLGRGPIAADPKPLEVWAGRIVFLDILPAVDLQKWQQEIMQLADPLRQGAEGPADAQPLRGLSVNEQHSYDTYQYPFVGDALRPHFTVGRLAQEESPSVPIKVWLQHLQPIPLSINLPRVVLFQVGKFGSLTHVFADCPV